MKTQLDISHEGSVGDSDRTKMTFDKDSIAHLMSVLTDLYSDPATAVIREYSTNAWDSHRAANNPAPIEITSPTELNPTFVIKDHGLGMSASDIRQRFSKYGFSSKRDTDNEVGMLGLGCKAGLAYTSQFTLLSVKDGLECMVLVTRDADGAGAVQIIAEEPTDNPNGVEVHIPVATVYSFTRKMQDFFRYWTPGSVLIDGAAPSYCVWTDTEDKRLQISDDVLLVSSREHDVIVMGNVPYPVNGDKVNSLAPSDSRTSYRQWGNSSVIARVPIGAVNFTPSREALQYTKRTLATIEGIRELIKSTVQQKAQDLVEAEPTHAAAIKTSRYWQSRYHGLVLTYKGKEFPISFEKEIDVPVEIDDLTLPLNADGTIPKKTVVHKSRMPVFALNTQYNDIKAAKVHSILADEAIKGLHITGFAGKAIHTSTRQRIMKYRSDNGLNNAMTYLYEDDDLCGDWYDGMNVVTFETIQAVELPKAERKPKDITAWRVINQNGQVVWTDYAPIAESVVWIEAGYSFDFSTTKANMAEVARLDGKKIYSVQKDAVARFNRENPEVPTYKDWLTVWAVKYVSSWTPLMVYSESYHAKDNLPDLRELNENLHKLFDPELRSLIETPNTQPMKGDLQTIRIVAQSFGIKIPALPSSDSVRDLVERINARYPLLKTRVVTYSRRCAEVSAWIQYLNDTYLISTRPYLTGECQ